MVLALIPLSNFGRLYKAVDKEYLYKKIRSFFKELLKMIFCLYKLSLLGLLDPLLQKPSVLRAGVRLIWNLGLMSHLRRAKQCYKFNIVPWSYEFVWI